MIQWLLYQAPVQLKGTVKGYSSTLNPQPLPHYPAISLHFNLKHKADAHDVNVPAGGAETENPDTEVKTNAEARRRRVR